MSPRPTFLLLAACLALIGFAASSAQADSPLPSKPAAAKPTTTKPAASAQPPAAEVTPLQKSIYAANPLKYDPILPAAGKPATLQLTHKNPTAAPLTVTITWSIPPDSPWKVEPATQTVTCAPGQSAQTTYQVTFNQRPDLYAAPLPELTTTFTSPDASVPIATRSAPLNADLATYYQARMVMFATRTAKPPVIDGKLDDTAWAACISTTHFVDKSATTKTPWATDVRICWDDQAVYVMARLAEPDLPGLYAKITQRNDKVWTDDSFEAIFDFDGSKYGFAQFMVNPNNVPYDTFGKRVRWDTIWTSQTGREKDAWTVEMAIPWAAMESPAPKPNERIRFQLVRNRVRDEKHTHWQWSPTFVHGNRIPAKFGSLVFIDPGINAPPVAPIPTR